MSNYLVEFLRARLEEDLHRLVPPDARWSRGEIDPRYKNGPYDSARVLREVEARRAIITAYEDARREYRELADRRARSMALDKPEPSDRERRAMAMADAYEEAIVILALPYAGRPDYREDWRLWSTICRVLYDYEARR